jgi:hypothetical protein
MNQIEKAIQQMLMDNVAPMQLLMADLPVSTTTVSVANSSRFRPGDQVLLASDTLVLPGQTTPGAVEKATIADIPDYDVIKLVDPVNRAWLMSDTSYILGAVNWLPLQRVYLGGLPALPKTPCITITQQNEDIPEWLTLQATKHDYRLAIKCFITADNPEAAELYLPMLAQKVREVLLDHIHPIVGGVDYPLLVDLPVGGTVVTISDTSKIKIPSLAFIHDAKTRIPARESVVRAVLSPTQVEIVVPAEYPYLVSRGAEFVHMTRYFYDTRVTSIRYGFVQKDGGMFKGAELSYYLNEELIRPGNVLT